MEPDAAPIEIAKMTKLQKLAALLIILGPESAAQILKNLTSTNWRRVSLEMSRLTVISQELQQEILREFTDVAVAGQHRRARRRRLHQDRPGKIRRPVPRLGHHRPRRPRARRSSARCSRSWTWTPRQLFNLLKQEQPQTIALIVSYLSPEKSSQVLCLPARRCARPGRRTPRHAGAHARRSGGTNRRGAQPKERCAKPPAP